MRNDIEIANSIKSQPIEDIAKKISIDKEYLEFYGQDKAKINFEFMQKVKDNKDGKLILVTAMSPTPAGEGKTTTSVGLTDALIKCGENAMSTLREPSLGPVFGMKGGATGGGYAQVIPMEDINLHFTGDIHAIGAANNLIAAMIDNHIFQGNKLNIDPRTITWRRVLDINDRQLRNIVNGLGGKTNGMPREDGFDITVASEIMAILCLANDMEDLKEKIANIVIGYNYDEEPVRVSDIKAQGAVATLLKDALKPNLVQTLEGTPIFIHGGPFANIAHGCNSVIATKLALKLTDYVVTEAGFGADLGAEKFLDIKCKKANLNPDAVVVVATIRALKYHGGIKKENLEDENLEALRKGFPNLLRHINNMRNVYGIPSVVAINKFPSDTPKEIELIKTLCKAENIEVELSEVWSKGGDGALELANLVIEKTKEENKFKFLYKDKDSIIEKIEKIVTDVYGGSEVTFDKKALDKVKKLEKDGFGNLPICMAKTQYSFSTDPKLLGAAKDFIVNVRDLKVSAGAGFIVVLTGNIMTMPGLPKVPAAEAIDIDNNENIIGLF